MNSGLSGRVGILGGTFNPFHLGHMVLAQDAFEQLGLTHVIFVPCATPPHKKCCTLIPARHRLAMLEAAIEGDERFVVSDIELKRGGNSYAIDTVREIHSLHPEATICFIAGSDSLVELHLWKDIYDILDLCEFRVFERPGNFDVKDAKDMLRLKSPWREKILADMTRGHRVEISSSEIRHRIAEGLSIRYLVHPAVEMYISEHRLYAG
ncbi:MAG: nicotinate-nucleotide adenylyltransferase [bacterium]